MKTISDDIPGSARVEERQKIPWRNAFPGVKRQYVPRSNFQRMLQTFMTEEGIVIQKNGTTSQSMKSFWEFYKRLKFFELALTACCCQMPIKGAGSFYVRRTNRKSHRPIFKYIPAKQYQRFFADHPELVRETRQEIYGIILKQYRLIMETYEGS